MFLYFRILLVTLGDLASYLREASASPNDLSNAVEYIDLGEAAELNICQLGAIQIAADYEKLIDRGIRGSVIYAPTDEIYEGAKTMIATMISVCGDLPEGYRLTRTPLAIKDVPAFLQGDSAEAPRLVA